MGKKKNVTEYDPTLVTVIVDGLIITGFAPDSVVTAVHNEDAATLTVGVQGDGCYNKNANNSGIVTLTLLHTSPSLSKLRDLAARKKQIRVAVADANIDGGFGLNEEHCMVQKVPETPRGKEAGSVSVPIIVPDMNLRTR